MRERLKSLSYMHFTHHRCSDYKGKPMQRCPAFETAKSDAQQFAHELALF